MRYCAEVEYDGTGYFGFQRQREEPTIQQELEQSINLVSGESVSITFAGRTDSGVHALGQVIAFEVDWAHGTNDLHRAINAKLSNAIVVKKLMATRSDFHPRFDARKRVYEYERDGREHPSFQAVFLPASGPLQQSRQNRKGLCSEAPHPRDRRRDRPLLDGPGAL